MYSLHSNQNKRFYFSHVFFNVNLHLYGSHCCQFKFKSPTLFQTTFTLWYYDEISSWNQKRKWSSLFLLCFSFVVLIYTNSINLTLNCIMSHLVIKLTNVQIKNGNIKLCGSIVITNRKMARKLKLIGSFLLNNLCTAENLT